MPKQLTADEILPLVAQLSPQEKARLLRLITAGPDSGYIIHPVSKNEFSSDDDPLAWDAEGWEDVG